MTLPLSFGTMEHPLPAFRGTETGVAFGELLSNVIALATFGAGILLLAYLIFGGVRYISAGGNEDAVEEAKRIMTNAVIGLIIAVAAVLITQVIGGILGFENILSPYFLGPGEALPEP